MFNLKDIAILLNCNNLTSTSINGIAIDSRKVNPGNIFVAIHGQRFDGHQFIGDAVANGAVAVVCSRHIDDINVEQLVVDDTAQALADIATYYRQQLSCGVIGLTGSNGKTTVKEMISSILPPPAHATPGNLNNQIGVPLSVFQLRPEHRYAVFELGANHVGDIKYTVAIIRPKVALINNIAPAHIEKFGSIENVASTKGEIYQGLDDGGVAVVNDDDSYAHFWDEILEHKTVLRFSIKKQADVYATDIKYDHNGFAQFTLVMPIGSEIIKLQVPGEHNVSNAVAAAACSFAIGIPLNKIALGLCQFTGVFGRLAFYKGINNAVIIDDTYNANLRSSLAAVDVLSARDGRRVMVFGDMGELGTYSKQHHQDVGRAAREHGIDLMMTCGDSSQYTSSEFGSAGKHYLNQELLVNDLLNELDENTTVLVKGSRSSHMENVVKKLLTA